jgi:tetraacyldisaccharide 4'-kinase
MEQFRILLLPFSWIYSIVLWIRNLMYDWNWKTATSIKGKSICIGNITVGGTGKSPLTAYIATQLKDFNPVILSRGYGRKTKGLLEANSKSIVNELGDEPFMYWKQFSEQVPVVVAEKRLIGVEHIYDNHPNALILLDDAFQHRAVKAGLNIVLMTYNRPVFNDFTFPAGNLREPRAGMKRAQICVVTKCPEQLTDADKSKFYNNIPLPKAQIFFTSIVYGDKKGLFGEEWKNFQQIILVTGIAQPEPLKRFLQGNAAVESISFPDHHDFTATDIQHIQQKVATFAALQTAIVTTEKDAVRLMEWKQELSKIGVPIFVQQMSLHFDREQDFNDLLRTYVTTTNEGSR